MRYEEGIIRAYEEGAIVGDGEPEDFYSRFFDHLQLGLERCNSRTLGSSAELILESFPENVPIDILELGAGAGAAVSGMRYAAPADSRIHTMGLTPINPFLRFSEFLARAGHLRHRDSTIVDELKYRGIQRALSQVRLNELLQIQEESGKKIFEVLDTPDIQTQFIGKFPQSVLCKDRLINGDVRYDFIYDSFGPLTHSVPESWDSAHSLLKPDGILFTFGTIPTLWDKIPQTFFVHGKKPSDNASCYTACIVVSDTYRSAKEHPMIGSLIEAGYLR